MNTGEKEEGRALGGKSAKAWTKALNEAKRQAITVKSRCLSPRRRKPRKGIERGKTKRNPGGGEKGYKGRSEQIPAPTKEQRLGNCHTEKKVMSP